MIRFKQLLVSNAFRVVFLIVSSFTLTTSYSQSSIPGIFFQAIARDNFSNPAKDRTIYVESSIIQSSATGTKVLTELHKTTTDGSGVFSISVGNGTKISGSAFTLNDIDWQKGPYYLGLKIAIQPVSPIANWDYTKELIDLGASPFGTVPYALYAGNTGSLDIKLNIADTAKMLSSYARVANLNSLVINKVNIADSITKYVTPTQLASKTFDSATIYKTIGTKLNISDSIIKYVTPTQLAAKTFDSTAIYNQLALKANTSDVNSTLGLKANSSDLTSGLNLKENLVNKTIDVSVDGTSDIKYPTAKAVKTYVDGQVTNSTVPDANPLTKGKIQLAGDLTGSAALPTIANSAISTAKINDGAVTDAKISAVSGSKITGNITGNAANVTGIVGVINGGTGASNAATARTNLGLAIGTNVQAPLTFNTPIVTNGNSISLNKATTSVDGYISAADFTSFNNKIDATQKAANNGVATLGNDGKIPSNQIPAISFQSATVVSSQSAMLALSSAVVGSIAIRTDDNNNYVLSALPASTLSNWIQLRTPTSVTSVNGNAGPNVVLTSNDVAEGITNKYYTDARARSAMSATAPLSYNSATGTISMTAASLSTNGYLSSTDFSTFNNKQNALTAGVDYLAPNGSAAALTNFPTLNQSTTGNAATATKLATARNINGVAFDGSVNITITADANTLTGTSLPSTVTTSSLTSVGTITSGTWSGTNIAISNGGTGANNANAALSNLGAESRTNKSTATDLGALSPSDILYPTQKAVKTYVDLQSANAGVADGSITNAKLAGSITANKLVGTDITSVGTITSGTWSASTIDIAHGGTGATNASGARTNLGLVIGTNVMAANAITTLTGDVTGAGNGSFATTVNSVGGVSSSTISGFDTRITTSANNIASNTSSINIITNSVNANTASITSNTNSISTINNTLNSKADLNSPNFTGTVSGITKSMVGLGNVENISLSTWTGSNNLSTVGTITSGTWSGSVIGSNVGGAGTVNGLLKANGSGVVSAAVAGTDYQVPLTSTQSNVLSNTSGINTGDETVSTIKTKLGISTLSGSNTGDQTITLTGDVTGTGTGSFATTINSIGGVSSSTIGGFDTRITISANNIASNTSSITTLTSSVNANTASITSNTNSISTINTSLSSKADLNSPNFTGTVSGITKSMVGLGNVENTSLSTWSGSNNLNTVGTITSGTWSGSVIGSNVGGAGTVNGLLKANGSGVVSAAVAGTDYQVPLTSTQSNVLSNTSGINTGDETVSTIKTKLGISTLSGSNTGDQTITLTGDVTGTGTGSFATTINSVGGVSSSTIGGFDTRITTSANNIASNTSSITSLTSSVASNTTSITSNTNSISTINTALSSKADLNSPTFTGTPNLPAGTTGVTQTTGDNSTKIATTAFVAASITASSAGISSVGPIAASSNANGATISGSTQLILTPADANFGGVVTTATQTFAGAKTFSNTATFNTDITINSITVGRGKSSDPTNTGVGSYVLYNVTTGSGNGTALTAMGYNALSNNTSGFSNTGVGYGSLRGNQNGSNNTALGYNALYFNTSGGVNTAVGSVALFNNTTGSFNTSLGNNSLNANTTGGSNTGVGNYSLYSNTTGGNNTGIGNNTLYYLSSGSDNVAVGLDAGKLTGSGAGVNLTNSNKGIYIGSSTRAGTNTTTNEVVIGYGALGNGSNTVTVGNLSNTATYFTGDINLTGNLNGGTWSGTAISIAKGGTGATTKSASFDALSPMTTAGDIIYGGTSGTGTRLGIGTTGQVLTVSGGAPSWSTPSGIPYTGATGAVNLGAYDLTVNGITVGKGNSSVISSLVIGTALGSNTASGTSNTAIGYQNLQLNSSGYSNTAVGSQILATNVSGYNNIGIGVSAINNSTNSNNNVGIGLNTLNSSSSMFFNVAIGNNALSSTSGVANTAIGHNAGINLADNTTNNGSNIFIGYDAGSKISTGSSTHVSGRNSIFIGRDTRPLNDNETNEIVIAGFDPTAVNKGVGLGSNSTSIGNGATTSARIYGSLSLPNTTASTSTSTGALIVSGGVGISGTVYVGGGVNASTFNGMNAGNVSSTYGYNTIFGRTAFNTTATSSFNTAVGEEALKANTSGNSNIAMGYRALTKNTTGASNVAIGDRALQNITTNNGNIGIGQYALSALTADGAVAIGNNAGSNLTTGNYNTYIGSYAGAKYGQSNSYNNTTSNGSVLIGYDTRGSADGNINEVVISGYNGSGYGSGSYGTVGNGSNTTTIGNSATTQTYIAGSILTGSTSGVISGEITIRPQNTTNEGGQINLLKSVSGSTYDWTIDQFRDASGGNARFRIFPGTSEFNGLLIDESGNVGLGVGPGTYKLNVSGTVGATGYTNTSDRRLKTNIHNISSAMNTLNLLRPVSYDKKYTISDSLYQKKELGFIAQEVQKVLPQLVVEGKDKDKLLSLDYISIIPLLTKAMQEQDLIIKESKEENIQLKAELDLQKKRMEEIEKLLQKIIKDKK